MKLTHPDRPGDVIAVPPQFAEMYQSQGWVEEAEKPADKPAPKK